MKRGWIMAAAGWAAVAAAEPLRLPEAYRLALAQSEALKIGQAELRAAEARYRRTRAGQGPEVTALGSGGARDPGTSSRDAGALAIGAGAGWTIFDGLRTAASAEAVRWEGEALGRDLERYRQLLYEDVADVFYQTVSDGLELAALQDQAAALEERAVELDRRVGLGRSRRSELLSTRVQQADLRVSIEEARARRGAARELLAFLTGRPAAELEPAADEPLPDVTAVARALSASPDRPDLLAAAGRIEAARQELAAARAERKPVVRAEGHLYAVREPDEDGVWDLGVKVELPLFDRGARQALAAERSEQVHARELRLAELRRTADRDVQVALRDLEGSLARWVALLEAVRVSGEAHDLVRRDYEMGRADNLDVLVALTQLHSLRRREGPLEMLVRANLVRLQVAAGTAAP